MSVKTLIESIASGQLLESKQSFTAAISEKLSQKLSEAKQVVAKSFFEAKEKEEDDEDEVSDDAWKTHPLKQLSDIADSKPLSDGEKYEYTASGAVNKNSKPWSVSVPTFKHKDGSETELHPKDAEHLSNILKGNSIKPETKEKVFAAIHGSKEGLSKVHSALSGKAISGKSIYGGDVRESEELDSQLDEISSHLAMKASSGRMKQGSDIYYNKTKTAGGAYNPENSEYKSAIEKGLKSKEYSLKKAATKPAQPTTTKKPLGGYDPKSGTSYSE